MTDEKINPEALRSAIQERIRLTEAATDVADGSWPAEHGYDGWMARSTDGYNVSTAIAEEIAVHIAAHDPSFMLRVYRQWLDVLDRHKSWTSLPPATAEGVYLEGVCYRCRHERWPCPEVRSVAAAVGLNEEET